MIDDTAESAEGRNGDPTQPLDNRCWEEFARQMAFDDITQAEASRRAGFSGSESAACKMANRPGVQARIGFLRADLAERLMQATVTHMLAMDYSKDDAMGEAEQIRRLALRDSDFKSALGAVVLKSRLAGHLVEGARRIGGLSDLTMGEAQAVLQDLNDMESRLAAGASETGAGSGPLIEGSAAAEA